MTWIEADELVRKLQIDAEDWSAWLVYADWLAEQGDGRAELIRLEHELATAVPDLRRRAWIGTRIASLVAASQEMSGIEVPATASLEWSRGFVVGVQTAWSDEGVRLFDAIAGHPLGRFLHALTLEPADEGGMNDDDVVALASLQALSRVTTLALRFHGFGEDGLRALAAAPALRNLTSLVLSLRVGDEGGAILAGADWIRTLRHLELSHASLGPDGLQALLAPGPAALVELGLCGNLLGVEGAEVLAEATLPRLERLDVSMNTLGSGGAVALAEGTGRALASLELWGNDIGASGVRALAEAGFFRGIRELNLGQNNIGDAGTLALVASASLAQCESLWLNHAKIGDRGTQALAEADLGSLVTLDLSDNHIGDAGAAALSTGRFGSLRSLDLSNNLVGATGARTLAGGTLSASVGIEGNDLDDQALVALCRAGRLGVSSVHGLLFRYDEDRVVLAHLGDEARRALVRCLDDDGYRAILEELPEAERASLAAMRAPEEGADRSPIESLRPSDGP